ncbi:MAG: hypothetical protein HOW97_12305, partial [Catenulispora sp.]|nr:hypothetical protein [Catenulispora sp.]
IDWSDRHRDVPEAKRRDDYQAAVERRILNALRPAAPVVGEQPATTNGDHQ